MDAQTTIKPYVIGLDLGGTNSVFGIVDSRGDIKATTAIKTQGFDKVEDYVDASVEALQVIIEQVGGIDNIKAMGIGAPNGNFYNGTIEFAPNLSWGHNGVVPLAKLFQDRLGVPVAVINGQLVYGCDGFAGELGHVIMERQNGRSCGCGRKGCLEAYCSATGVARSAREFLLKSDQPSLLREMNPDDITSLDVSIAAGKGDALAKEVFEFTGDMLGAACADFAAFSSPEAFIFFGGLVKAGDLIMEPIKRSYDEKVLPIFKGKAKFLISGLDGASAAVLGASAIGWEI